MSDAAESARQASRRTRIPVTELVAKPSDHGDGEDGRESGSGPAPSSESGPNQEAGSEDATALVPDHDGGPDRLADTGDGSERDLEGHLRRRGGKSLEDEELHQETFNQKESPSSESPLRESSSEPSSGSSQRIAGAGIEETETPMDSSSSMPSSSGQETPQFPAGSTLHLRIRQQPLRCRMMGYSDRDKRPIDPVPVIQLVVKLQDGTEFKDWIEGSIPTFVMRVVMMSQDGLSECEILARSPPEPGTSDFPAEPGSSSLSGKKVKALVGRTIVDQSIFRDETGRHGCFFYFSDLSVRKEGVYRLRFDLIQISMKVLDVVDGNDELLVPDAVQGSVMSEPVTVYFARKFPGMLESSSLIRLLASQGAKIPVRTTTRGSRNNPDDGGDSADEAPD